MAELVGSSVCACVSCDRVCWDRLRRARRLEKVLPVVLVSSSAVSIVSPGIVVAVICCEWRDSER
jgi:hypothetical protein